MMRSSRSVVQLAYKLGNAGFIDETSGFVGYYIEDIVGRLLYIYCSVSYHAIVSNHLLNLSLLRVSYAFENSCVSQSRFVSDSDFVFDSPSALPFFVYARLVLLRSPFYSHSRLHEKLNIKLSPLSSAPKNVQYRVHKHVAKL